VPSLQGTYEKLALNQELFKRGAHADSIMGARKFTDEEAKRFDDDLHASYLRFVELAAHGRNKKPEEMEELAQGRTWLGDKALELGLVDKLGGFDAAIALAKEKAGIPAGDPVTIKQYEREVDLFTAFRRDEDEDEDAPDLGAVLVQKLLEQSGYAPLLRRLPAFTPFARAVLDGRERMFPMMEYRVEVH